MIARLAVPSAGDKSPLNNVQSISEQAIRNLMPWQVNAYPDHGGIVLIAPKPPVMQSLANSTSSILLRGIDVNAVVEVLSAMLVALILGSDLRTVFARGAYTADLINMDVADGLDIPPQPECTSPGDPSHWHICPACLDGFPCSGNELFTHSTICSTCLLESKAPGSKLKMNEARTEDLPHDIFDDYSVELAQLAATPTAKRTMAPPRVKNDLLLRIKEESRAGDFSWDEARRLEERDAIFQQLQETYGTDQPGKWHDLYVKQVLDEDVARNVDWTGREVSMLMPSVEGIRMVYFQDGISRYHTPGNCGITSYGMNMMLGRNPKIIARALKQYITASDPHQYQAAIKLLHRCMVLRFELELNLKWNRVGTPQTPYFRSLRSSYHNGTIPARRYVPKKVFSSLGGDFRTLRGNEHKPDYRPPNYDEYIRPQTENVAERYGFLHTDRDLWTLNDPQITGGYEVPFFFSQNSVITSWTWWDCFCWLCERMLRLKTLCDNHSLEAYRDNPESRRTMNIERFYLALLHIHLWKLARNRDQWPTWAGRRPRALDDAGLECFCNIRTPLSPSIAHLHHGSVMLLGFINVLEQFPQTQGPDVFDHDIRNVDLQTWLLNSGVYTDDVEASMAAVLMRQFHDLRDRAEDFVAIHPEAPIPYSLSAIVHNHHQHHLALNPHVINEPDEDFKPRETYAGSAPGWTKRPRQKESRRANKRTDQPDESAADNEGDMAETLSEDDDLGDLDLWEDADLFLQMAGEDDDEPPEDEAQATEANLGKSKHAKQPDLPFHPGTTSTTGMMLARANFARGQRTCYISSALQALHNIPVLASIIKSIASPDTKRIEVLRSDPGLKLHEQFLGALKSCFTELDTCALTTEKVEVDHIESFRLTCDEVVKLSEPRLRLPDRDADSVEFLFFILKTLNTISDRSGVRDHIEEKPLRHLESRQDQRLLLGESLPRMEDDIDRFSVARKLSGFMSEVEEAHTIQVVVETKCDNPRCGCVKREFEFCPSLTLSTTVVPRTTNGRIGFSQLRQHAFKDKLKATAKERTHCPYCPEDGPSGSLVEVRKRMVNEPELLFILISRQYEENKKFFRDLRRLQDFGEFDLKDWTPPVFSDSPTYEPSSVKYNLVEVLLYGDSPPHYYPYIRLGKATTTASNGIPTVRHSRLNDGDWVKFDDMQSTPHYGNPFGELPQVILFYL